MAWDSQLTTFDRGQLQYALVVDDFGNLVKLP